jgi:hypothetical protein
MGRIPVGNHSLLALNSSNPIFKEKKEMKRTIITFASLALIFVLTGSLLATDKGNSRKGKYTFRKSCRDCHVEGGKAQEMSPSNKTQAQWDTVFAKDKYKEFPCKAEWDKLTSEDLGDIYAYMYEHAFDSPSPAKCK